MSTTSFPITQSQPCPILSSHKTKLYTPLFATFMVFSPSLAQLISFCTGEDCENCPDSITAAGSDVVDDCVIYDTETVFGGQGFPKSDGEFLYEAWPKYSEPCGGEEGALMIRSPATKTDGHCGNLVQYSNDATCSPSLLQLKETFMVRFCCGFSGCEADSVPAGRSLRTALGQRTPGGATGGLYLFYPNGTMIEPLEVGKPEAKTKHSCTNGWEDGSYTPNGDFYLSSFDNFPVSQTIDATKEERDIKRSWTHTIEMTTSFDVLVGDPFGVISAGVGFEFTESEQVNVDYTYTVPANESGTIYFTPIYKCTKGALKNCDGEIQLEGESCMPHVLAGASRQ